MKTVKEEVLDRIDALDAKRRAELNETRERLKAVEAKLTARAFASPSDTRRAVGGSHRPVSLSKIITAVAETRNTGENAWQTAGAEYERDVIAQHRTAMAGGFDTLGGYVVPEEYLPQEFIELLRAKTIALQLGARELSDLTGSPVRIPRHTGSATGYWVAENAAITESNETLGDMTLQPRKLAALVKSSNELLMLGNPSVEALIMEDLARGLALKLDLAIIAGTGSNNEPLGIKNTTGILTTSMNAPPNEDSLLDMVYQLEANNSAEGKLGWACDPLVWDKVRRMRDGNGRRLFSPDNLAEGIPQRLLGFPVRTSTQMDATADSSGDMIFGDWSQCIVASWGGLRFAVSTQADTAFAADQTWIRVTRLVDIGIRHPESFVVDNTVSCS